LIEEALCFPLYETCPRTIPAQRNRDRRVAVPFRFGTDAAPVLDFRESPASRSRLG